MTDKEKARAYDEALALAKRLISNNCTEVEKLCLKCVFPELKESEDERIRKTLISYFEWVKERNCKSEWNGLKVDDIRAWLEKQKEQKPVDFPTTDEEVKEFLETHPKVEVPEKYKTSDFVFSKQEYESHPIISKDTTSVKPAEWSEEDEKIYDKALDALYYKDCNEKDDVIYALENLCDLIYRKRKRIPKYARWKPSEEQMAMLLAVINEPNNAGAESCRLALKSLYEHLKKLM